MNRLAQVQLILVVATYWSCCRYACGVAGCGCGGGCGGGCCCCCCCCCCLLAVSKPILNQLVTFDKIMDIRDWIETSPVNTVTRFDHREKFPQTWGLPAKLFIARQARVLSFPPCWIMLNLWVEIRFNCRPHQDMKPVLAELQRLNPFRGHSKDHPIG